MVKKKLTLSKFIAREREKLNLSQTELAKKCRIPAGTLASIESGYAKSPRSVTLKKLAFGLNVPLDTLFTLASEPEKEVYVDFEEIELVKLPNYGQIPKEINNFDPEKPESYVGFPVNLIEDGELLFSANGDVFIQEDIFDNDYIVIKKQNCLKRSGDLMAVKLQSILTLTRVYKHKNGYKLDNKEDSFFTPDKIEFIGMAVSCIGKKKL